MVRVARHRKSAAEELGGAVLDRDKVAVEAAAGLFQVTVATEKMVTVARAGEPWAATTATQNLLKVPSMVELAEGEPAAQLQKPIWVAAEGEPAAELLLFPLEEALPFNRQDRSLPTAAQVAKPMVNAALGEAAPVGQSFFYPQGPSLIAAP
jgi:hypothetical protein